MNGYLSEFLTLALVHFLAVVSPGPDLAVTTANSVRYGRKIGIMTAIGIGFGISIHVIYSLIGLSFLHEQSTLFNVIRLLGALYLLYLAYLLIGRGKESDKSFSAEAEEITSYSAFLNGFLTNVLNPKAVLFFVAIFTSLISPNTPLFLKIGYGLWMCSVNALWFTFVALFFTKPAIRQAFLLKSHYFNRIMGVILALLAFYVGYEMLGIE
ncbi:lysine transporter LysE [Gallibacterium genomosp. 2]|uniref:Lysine transporter LysE n=1 Tax=Gallibacterium genomosp. 2 TaxID=155517 RepID=A0A0A2XYP4_9PAST|nr:MULTISPECIES: LysE family transporter [Gallibacterium]KGQ30434.1 lysine transporter LysE [Gallibacterium genomosp. 2]KGQ41632.1 lysine transporter LysE [Gallibacterium anatis IPDH697-78]